ncbi:MAG: S-layer protein [Methanoregulaceae archaeon]
MHVRRLIFLILIIACCSVPVFAATNYMGGSPDFSVAITGVNEFTPGQDTTINIIVQNSGLNPVEQLYWGTIDQEDPPNTAKLVTIGLSSGSAPITIKSDPQMVGDVKGSGGSVTVNFAAKISNDAVAGEYQLPLFIQYKYLKVMKQENSEFIQFTYNKMNQTFPITLKIKPEVKIEVLEATPETLNVGTEGYLHLKIKNIGPEDGKNAIVMISRSGQSPIIPTDSSVFVGDYPTNGVIECRYKVSILSNTENHIYPIDVSVTYENKEGTIVTTSPYTIGVPIGGKTNFVITSSPPLLIAGSRNAISVQYQNNGGTTIYNAQARITAVDPFTSSDDSAYLGDLKPGDIATAKYDMSVDDAATPKEYSLDSEVRYRDALDNSQLSNTINVNVQVLPKSNSINLLTYPITLVFVLAVVIAAGYYLLLMRKKK